MKFFERIDNIEAHAFKVISELKIKKAPIPIEKIVQKMGLELLPYNFDNEASGILVIANNKGTIGYSPTDSKVRQRFTIAHELGHFVLHKTSADVFIDKDFLVKYRNVSNAYTQAEMRQEFEANAFAAALLMPKLFIEEQLQKKDLQKLQELVLIKRLAKHFKVSEPAMTYRLTNLNYLG